MIRLTKKKNIPFTIPKGVEVIKEYFFDYAAIRLRNDGITQINTADGTHYTLKETMEVHSKVTELNGLQPILILHVPGLSSNADDESRKFLASEKGLHNRLAFAFVLQSLSQRLVANFYIRMNQPKRPTKFFSNQHDAEKWLLSIIPKKYSSN